jgi:predicted O-linked N-acetylglucosamine transferase (SPINDLY family)/glycosyltransferase involved in cell wall biosynthesis
MAKPLKLADVRPASRQGTAVRLLQRPDPGRRNVAQDKFLALPDQPPMPPWDKRWLSRTENHFQLFSALQFKPKKFVLAYNSSLVEIPANSDAILSFNITKAANGPVEIMKNTPELDLQGRLYALEQLLKMKQMAQSAELAAALATQGVLPISEVFAVCQLLNDANLPAQAIALYRLWLEHTDSPASYAVMFNLGVSLANANDDAGAEQVYRRSLVLNPTFIEAHLNLAALLERKGEPQEALLLWNNVTAIANPAVAADKEFHLQALNNMGRLLEIRKHFPEAEAVLTKSLLVDPKQPKVTTHLIHLRQKQCKWPIYQAVAGVSLADMVDATSALAMLSASGDPQEQLDAARRFITEKVLPATMPLAPTDGYSHDKLRIGYLSSDLCSHAVSILTAELYELHDRSRVEVFAFSWSNEDGTPLRARVVKAMDHYISIAAMSDEEAARCIRSHEIDILVDLHGLTLGTRPDILSWRPAPVQMTYLGFPGSTALPCIDYVIADEFVLPPELVPYFTERPLYMPNSFQINDRQRQIGPRPTRASCGLPDDAFVFCSFNNNFKFTEEVFASWMRILLRVPGSVLWLVSDHASVRQNLCASAQQLGVDPARLLFAPRVPPTEYLARYQIADLFLDTIPFNAGTTASDALWAGLPLLTCAGRTFSSRMAGSLLLAVGLPELITHSLQDYEDKAVALAQDRPKIAAMKQQLTDQRLTCSLFDSPQFVRDLEGLFEKIAKGTRVGKIATREAGPSESAMATPAQAGFPLVSIVIPSYKPGHFEQCLKSAIGQTYPNIEILVSDNCPTDEIRDICRKYGNVIYQRCSVIRVDNVVSALFSGKGKYIKPLFDDDILHPFCVERMVSVMQMRDDVELVFSASQVINIDNQPTETRRPYAVTGSLTASDMQRSMALGFCNFIGEFTSIMFKRQKIWDIGWHDLFRIAHHDFTKGLADVAFYCNVARGGAAFYIDEELSYFRRDQRLMSNSNISSNMDFGFCFSDYIDLAIVSHKTDLISTAELVGLEQQVEDVAIRLREVFYQVGDARGRYLGYVKDLEPAVIQRVTTVRLEN